jgi:hypothetical protein
MLADGAACRFIRYLYLLFDEDNAITPYTHIFTTEAIAARRRRRPVLSVPLVRR